MKVYVVYESYYGEIIVDTGSSTNLIGVYSDIEKAKENVEDRVKYDLENYNYVLDQEIDNIITEKGGFYRLFYENQENWSYYYEIIVEEREVE